MFATKFMALSSWWQSWELFKASQNFNSELADDQPNIRQATLNGNRKFHYVVLNLEFLTFFDVLKFHQRLF